MQSFKKRLVIVIFLSVLSAAIIISCGKQAGKDESQPTEAAGDHPSDSTEHPSDSTEHPAEHPADETKN